MIHDSIDYDCSLSKTVNSFPTSNELNESDSNQHFIESVIHPDSTENQKSDLINTSNTKNQINPSINTTNTTDTTTFHSPKASRDALLLLLNIRNKELNELRAQYFTELQLLRGQLFGVKINKDKNAKAIKFQVESDLELNLAAIRAAKIEAATLLMTSINDSKTSKIELKQLKQLINQGTSNQELKMNILLDQLKKDITRIENKNNILKDQMTMLENTGKSKLKNEIKQLRIKITKLNAESERKQEKLRNQVKFHQSAAESSARKAVSSALTTKEGVKTIFRNAMININKHENIIQDKLNELDERIEKNCTDLSLVTCQLSAQCMKREREKKKGEKEKLKKEIEQTALIASQNFKKDRLMQEKKKEINIDDKIEKVNLDEKVSEVETEVETEEERGEERREERGEERGEKRKGEEEMEPSSLFEDLSIASFDENLEEYLIEFERTSLLEEENTRRRWSIDRSSQQPSPPRSLHSRKRIVSPRNRSHSSHIISTPKKKNNAYNFANSSVLKSSHKRTHHSFLAKSHTAVRR